MSVVGQGTVFPAKKTKVHRHTKPSFTQFQAPDLRFHTVHCDIVGPFPTSPEGFKYLLTVVCRFTKWMEAIPLRSLDAKTVARAFFNRYISPFFRALAHLAKL